MKLNVETIESIDDDDIEEYKEEEEKIPICKRCWIFKRNKDFVQENVSTERSLSKKVHIDVNRHVNHKKFLACLKDYQQSQPYEKTIKPAVITQVASDSEEDVKNLFVNNKIVHNSKVNVKAIVSSINQKKEGNSPLLPQNSIFNGSRSLRLSRKCKQRTVFSLDPFGNDDFLFGDTDSEFQQAGKIKKEKVTYAGIGKTTSFTIPKKVIPKLYDSQEEVIPPSPDKLLEEDTEESKEVISKKRKVEVNTKDNDDTINVGARKLNGLLKRVQRRVNGEGEPKRVNVIEIDGEGSEKEEEPHNKKDTNITPKVNCPMCNRSFPSDQINDHAYTCQGPQTQTRSRQIDNQDSLPTYNASAWESACQGLNKNNNETLKKAKDPVEHLDHGEISENKFENKGRDRLKQNNIKDPLKDVNVASKGKVEHKNENIYSENVKQDISNKLSKLFTTKTSGYVDMSSHDTSTAELIKGYTTTMNKIKNPRAKQMRSFGEHGSEEHEMAKCARCDQYVADDQLKNHTDNCLDKSVLID